MSYEIFSLDSYAQRIGTIKPNGEVFSLMGERRGRISSSGEIKDIEGNFLGIVNLSGVLHSEMIDTSHYRISRDGTIMHVGEVIGAVKQKEKGIHEVHARWGAFALFHSNFVQAELVEEPEVTEIEEKSAEATIKAVFQPIKQLSTAVGISMKNSVKRSIARTKSLPNMDSLENYAQMRIAAFMHKKEREMAAKGK